MKLTVLIISYKSIDKLKNCLSTIGTNRKIIVVENSDNRKIKTEIETNYKNCEVFLNNSNLGYSQASNIGFKLIKTDYALLLNTDVIITENQINQIENEAENLNENFTIASPLSDDLIDFNKNNKIDPFFKNNISNFNQENKITNTDLIKGCSLLVNLKKFKNKEIFDKNFFFFFEEIDLCRKVKENGGEIYIFNQIKIEHKSAQSLDENFNEKYHNFRHWNYFWGRFYYFKKHYGFIYSLSKHTGKLIRFAFNIFRYYFISKTEYDKNKYRFLGLFNSMIGKKSDISVKILEN